MPQRLSDCGEAYTLNPRFCANDREPLRCHAVIRLVSATIAGAILLIIAPIAVRGATVDVTVGPGLSFTPASVTIAIGDTVRWDWAGALHSSTSDNTTGAEVWNSGLKSTGTFSHTFSTAGDWPYYCTLHSSPGGTAMNGVVHVTAAPTLTSVNPTAGPSTGGTLVTLTGTNFISGCTAVFGGTPATTNTVVDATTMTATTPAHAPGVVSVDVNCSSGTATLMNGFTFTLPPTISNVQPSSAPPGALVTITGSNFVNGANVLFGSTPASGVTFVDSGTLLAIVPAVPPGPVTVTVINPDARRATFDAFVVLAAAALPLLSGAALVLLIAALAVAGVIALRT